MFHFPGFPPPALYIQAGVTPHHGCRVPPFGHPRINARLTAPRGLSRPPTSFIGSWYQGIHHAPLHTYTPPAHTGRAPHTAFGTHQRKSTHYNNHHTRPLKQRPAMVAMLASTIQFTNTHPQPAAHQTRHHHPRPTAQAPRTTRDTQTRQGQRQLLRDHGRPGPPETTPPGRHDTTRRVKRRDRPAHPGACSLRTQQCADPTPPPRAPTDTTAGHQGTSAGRLRCSTNEHTPRAARSAAHHGCECSLERR